MKTCTATGPSPTILQLRLSRYSGTNAQFWLNLQARFDLETARDRFGARLQSEVEVFAAAL